jgi:glycine/D-amino acid oxidase-like deaminating enzyme
MAGQPTDDVLIIGGGVIGSSIAYHLARDGRAGKITVIERDPTYEFAATPRSLGGTRQQFSLPENVKMSQYGLGIWRNFDEDMAVDGEPARVDLREQGYLFLADAAGLAAMVAAYGVQRELGAPVEMLDRGGLVQRFPWLNVEGIEAGVFGREDGWLDPHGALQGYRRKARSLGVEYIADEVVDIASDTRRAHGVRLKSGTRRIVGKLIVAAGAWSAEICAMVDMPLPVAPVRRMVFQFDIRGEIEPMPLVIDPTGAYFRPEGAGYLSGRSRLDEPAGVNFEVDFDYFDESIWPVLANRVPAFEALKVAQAWACLYDLNQLDKNLIIGPWLDGPGRDGLENFYIACGFSGHGLQQAPAVGRAMAELILDGYFVTIDLKRLSYQRVIDSRPLSEIGIV